MRTVSDKDTIIKEIRAMRDQNLPLYPSYLMKHHANLLTSALRQFGSWNKALDAAGIKIILGKVYRSRLTIVREIRDALKGRSKEAIPQALSIGATQYFGSLQKALAALKRDQRLARGWSKEK